MKPIGMRIIGLCIGLLALFNRAAAQNKENIIHVIDSLKVVAEAMPDDTNKVMLLNRISFEYNTVSPYDGIRYGVQAMALAEQLEYLRGMARANSCLGANYFSLSDFPNAYSYWLQSLELNRKTNNQNGVANHLHNIGMVYFAQENYDKAIEYYNQALEVSQEIGNLRFATNTYTAIGNIYSRKKDYNKALEYHYKAMAIDSGMDDMKSVSSDMLNIGAVYSDQGNTELALETLRGALAIKKEIGDRNGAARAYHLIGKTLYNRSQRAESKSDDIIQARIYLDSAVTEASQIGYLENLQSSHELLARIHEQEGELSLALRSAKAYHAIKDSIFSVSRQTELFNLERKAAKAEQDKKDELAMAELKKQKMVRNAFISGFAILLLLFSVIFSQRNRIAREKRRSDDLLLNILPEEVANELKVKGSAEAKLIDNVTVLFTDFKGFTELSQKLTPKELVSEIDECFSAFDQIMKRHGVEKIKTIGDAYMAVGGLPTPNTTHALDVVRAALDISTFMREYKQRRIAEGRHFFEIRIGVHTGPVVAGVVGLNKFAYDVWGDTVNTAQRMESSSEAGRVNISETTHYYVKEHLSCEYRGKIEAKGKGLIDMYFAG
jgi:adenylate cyclase